MRFPDPYSDRDDGHVPRQPEDTDTCLMCGKTRAAAAVFVEHGSQRERSHAALTSVGTTHHLCIRCVKYLARCAGLIGATKHPELVITCCTDRGCPFGAQVALSPQPISKASLVAALHALGWACSPNATLFTCPRCIAHG